MKKLSMILSLCMIMGIGFTQLSAQASQEWTKSTYWTPVFCNGALVDILEGGSITVHTVTHSNWAVSGIYQNIQIKGTVTSDINGEVFTIKETDKIYRSEGQWLYTWKFNLKGNMGTHYIGVLTQSFATGAITIDKAVCH